jgi:hypothetical protein
MNLTLKQVTKILTESIYNNKCIACAHIGYQGGELPQPIAEETENAAETEKAEEASGPVESQPPTTPIKSEKYDLVSDKSIFGDESIVEDIPKLILANLLGVLQQATNNNESLIDNETYLLQKVLRLGASHVEAKINALTDRVVYRLSKYPEMYTDFTVSEDLFQGQPW